MSRGNGLTPEGRERIAEAARRRWARFHAQQSSETETATADHEDERSSGGITPAGRAKLSRLMKERWAAVHAEKAAEEEASKPRPLYELVNAALALTPDGKVNELRYAIADCPSGIRTLVHALAAETCEGSSLQDRLRQTLEDHICKGVGVTIER